MAASDQLLLGAGGGVLAFAPPLLDNFNRANEGPPPSASYTTPAGFSGQQVFGNACGGAAIDNMSRWNTQYAANQQCAVDLTVPPLNGQAIRVIVRQQDEVDFRSCYYAEFVSNTPAPGTLRFWKRLTITDTQLGADITLAADLSTQQLGIRALGTTITAYVNGVAQGSRIDGDVTGAGWLMVNCTDATTRFDNLRGGAV